VWEHSAISATIVDLFGLPKFLTMRDSWAGSFAELLTETSPRTDTPMHLPDAPEPTSKVTYHGCGTAADITRRQRKHVKLWQTLLGNEPPAGWEQMGFDELQVRLGELSAPEGL
jgi:phospholipase C